MFIDTACGVDGYQTDKTMTYFFGRSPPDEVSGIQRRCEDLERVMAGLLRPENTPSSVYARAMERLSPDFLENFMGFGNRRAGFLGHGVGLVVEEPPVIAPGFG